MADVDPHFCKCGCGRPANDRFLRGHHMRQVRAVAAGCFRPDGWPAGRSCDIDWGALSHRHCQLCNEACSANHTTCGGCMAQLIQDPMGYCQLCGHETPTLLCDVCNVVVTREIQRAMGEPEHALLRIPRVDDEQGSHGELSDFHRAL